MSLSDDRFSADVEGGEVNVLRNVLSTHTSLPGESTNRLVLKVVLFDFDLTLTTRDSIDAHRVFPERGFGGEIDISWLHEKAFGGRARFLRLHEMLKGLVAQGVELHILSFADRELIERTLSALNLHTIFEGRITGGEELEGSSLTAKGHFIKGIMELRGWRREEVLFVDDQAYNLRGANDSCLVHWVRGRGLSIDDMIEIEKLACKDVASTGKTAGRASKASDDRRQHTEESALVNLV